MKRIVPVLLCVATLMAAPAQGVLDAADKQLLEAVSLGRTHEVRLLLDAGANPNIRTEDERTVLFVAVKAGRADVDVVQALLDVGTDVNARDAEGALPLHWVISDEKSAVVQLFLKGGADVNSRDHQGSTPLHLAAVNDSREVARLLLNASADVNTRNTTGNTALHWSVLWGRHEIARLLLDAGADMNTPDADFITPLDLVDLAGEEFLRLLGAEANVNAWSAEARRSRFELYNSCKPIDISVGLQLSGNEGVQGLTEETIQAALESRLRAARLYDSDASSYYFVRVHLMDDRIGDKHVGWVYGTNVSFNKWVWDEVSGQRRFASTWERSSMGIASSAESVGESILGNVRGYMDQFLAEYLRVNEKTCE